MPNSIEDIVIDVAVLSKEHSSLEIVSNNNHIIHLDEIQIPEGRFRQIFYPYGDFFGIDTQKTNADELLEFVSFQSPWRTVNGQKFSLLDEIIGSAEEDLNVSRNCFTTCSMIELTNDMSKIKSLCDIGAQCLLTALTWSNIMSVVRENTLSKDTTISTVKPLLVVNVVFKNPNPNVKPTMIKFPFRLDSISLN